MISKTLLIILFAAFISLNCVAQKSNMDSVMEMVKKEAYPVYEQASTTISLLTTMVDMAKAGTAKASTVIADYNRLVGGNLGKQTTLKGVEEILSKKGAAYIEFMYVKEQSRIMFLVAGQKKANEDLQKIKSNENKIMLDAGGTKGKSGAYIPMDNNIKALFIENGIDKAPGNYYVFGIKGKPAEQHFGTGFFSKRFRKVRDAAGLSSDYTLYAGKHTRVIHLKQDGLSDADIMALTRHKDFVAYAKYLRDLGMAADPENINKVSRKV